MSTDTPTADPTCNECQVGTLATSRITYMTRFGGRLLTVPNFPAWRCNVCGWVEYDASALEQLQAFLTPAMSLGHEDLRRRRVPNTRPRDRRPGSNRRP